MKDFILKSYKESLERNHIDNDLYKKYDVKKGLRNENGTGVLVALTKIADVVGYEYVNGEKVDTDGRLYYRGIDLFDIVANDNGLLGYERTCYLILFGKLPNDKELKEFHEYLSERYELPKEFMESFILKNPSKNLMNNIQMAVLTLYTYDENPDLSDPYSTLIKGLNLLAKMPSIISYSYQAKRHVFDKESLYIHHPNKELSIAENILYLSRPDGNYTYLEADVLDLILTIQADHGGGNNSTFTSVVISSTGTDIYSSMVGSIGSLKGPKHGGANKEVSTMMKNIINKISINSSDDEIRNIIDDILNKRFNGDSGLLYGFGHAIYSKSDPRVEVLRKKCKDLALEKDRLKDYEFYERFEKIAISEFKKRKGNDFNISANLDYYTGLIYELLNIAEELYTPIFATARVVGWLAHNIEYKMYCNKIVRPASKYVGDLKRYEVE